MPKSELSRVTSQPGSSLKYAKGGKWRTRTELSVTIRAYLRYASPRFSSSNSGLGASPIYEVIVSDVKTR